MTDGRLHVVLMTVCVCFVKVEGTRAATDLLHVARSTRNTGNGLLLSMVRCPRFALRRLSDLPADGALLFIERIIDLTVHNIFFFFSQSPSMAVTHRGQRSVASCFYSFLFAPSFRLPPSENAAMERATHRSI
jgi:hypothetical protein